jgi:mannose-6-phosphate isomerase
MINVLKPLIVRKIWGGQKLEAMKGLSLTLNDASIEPIGETLEIASSHLPYLAKFIDTSDELSIQVHPHDDYARMHENSTGKTECWIILEAKPLAKIYLGLKPGVTKDVLKDSLKTKRPINELLNSYEVMRGDFFFVPAGSIHAIGGGITLAEVQQNSGITYRVWDWDRLDEAGNSRELHIQKSLDVINFYPESNSLNFFKHEKNLFSLKGKNEVCLHPDFHLFLFNLDANEKYSEILNLIRPCSLLNLNGKIIVNGNQLDSYAAVTIDSEKTLVIESPEAGSFLLIM